MKGKMIVSRKRLLQHIAENPGQSTRQMSDLFGTAYDHLWDRFRSMEDEGYIIRSKRLEDAKCGGNKAVVVWTVAEVMPVRTRNDWTEEDEAALVDLYPHAMPDQLRARFPARSLLAIRKKAEGMGLKRNPGVVSKARQISSRLGHMVRHAMQEDPTQVVRFVSALESDTGLVAKAISRRTPLEQAWSAR